MNSKLIAIIGFLLFAGLAMAKSGRFIKTVENSFNLH
jgi:hypothetical protein